VPTFVPTTTGKSDKKAPFDFGASDKAPAYKSIRPGPAIGLAGAVADALRRTGEPASAVAYLAQGKPKEALGSIADIVRQKEKVRTIGLSDIPIIKRGTDKLPWYIRAPTNFGLDIAGDPLTYLTFGTAGVARGASGRVAAKVGGRETAALAGKRIATSRAARGAPEAMPLLQDAASAAALTALERKGLDPAFQVGLRIPFSREKAINVAGLNLGRAKRALDSGGGRIPGGTALNRSTRESFLPSRGAGKGMRYIHQTTRRAAEVEARAWQKEAQDLGKRIFERARKEGVKPADLNRLITRHIDNPTKYDAPTFAQDLVADTRAVFERISQRELADGVRRESRENYIPHLIIKDRDAKDLGAKYSDPLVTQENPFFTKQRAAENFDELDFKGVKYETNIERLIEARSAASTRARVKLAIDKATYERFGVARPLNDVPDRPPADLGEKWEAVSRDYLEGARDDFAEKLAAWRTAEAAGTPNRAALHTDMQVARQRLMETDRMYRQGVKEAAAKDAEDVSGWEKKHGAAGRENDRIRGMGASRIASPAEWRKLQQGWQEIASAPRFKDAMLPPQAAKDLKAVHKAIADSMKDPIAPLKFLRATGGTWKRLALATPGFHVRNQFDDALRAWWAGARNPQSYVQSARVLRGGNLSIKTKSGTYNGDELFDLARTHGVVDVGFVAQEAASSESRHRIRVDAMRYGRGRYANVLKASEDVGAFREDWNRMGLFIERLKAGDNPVQAAEQVRKYMFDYGDVGAFVSTARRYWTPFITYASKSIPLVAGEFARRPGRLSHIYAAQRTAWEEAGQPDMSTLAPEDRLSLPLPPAVSELLLRATGAKTAKGENPTLLLNPKGVMGYSMLNDIASIRGFRGTEKFASSFLGPAPKFGMEFIPGRSMYFGRDFAKSGVKANAVEALLARATGGRGFNPDKEDAYTGEKVLGVNARLSYLMRLLPQVNQASAVATLIPGAQGTNTSARLPAFRTLGGLPITPLDRAKRQWEIEKFGGD
jgi:hypothetical protein